MSHESEISNARIKSTDLGKIHNDILGCFLHLEGDGWGVGFGGHAFCAPSFDEHKKFLGRHGTAYGMIFIKRVLDTVGVERWEDLVGKYVRAKHQGAGGRCLAIGHITEDKWFEPETDAQLLVLLNGGAS